jgi:vacuolar-type H+-ATPase subunit H
MASETVNRVLEAEQNARERVAAAKAEAERSELEARQNAEKTVGDRLEAARQYAEKIRAENRLNIEAAENETALICEKEKERLEKSAESRLSLAADAVIDALFG